MSDEKSKKSKSTAPATPAQVELPPVGSAARKALVLQGALKE